MPTSGQLRVVVPTPLVKEKSVIVVSAGLSVNPSPAARSLSNLIPSGVVSLPKFFTALGVAQLLRASAVTLNGIPAATNLAPVASDAAGLLTAALSVMPVTTNEAGRTTSVLLPLTEVAVASRTLSASFPTSAYLTRTLAVAVLSNVTATGAGTVALVGAVVARLTELAHVSLLSCSTRVGSAVVLGSV